MVEFQKAHNLLNKIENGTLLPGEAVKMFFGCAQEIFEVIGVELRGKAEEAPEDDPVRHYVKAYSKAVETFGTVVVPQIESIPSEKMAKADILITGSGIVYEVIGLEGVMNQDFLLSRKSSRKVAGSPKKPKKLNKKQEEEKRKEKKEKKETTVNSVKEIIETILDALDSEESKNKKEEDKGIIEKFGGWFKEKADAVVEKFLPGGFNALVKSIFEVIDEIIKLM